MYQPSSSKCRYTTHSINATLPHFAETSPRETSFILLSCTSPVQLNVGADALIADKFPNPLGLSGRDSTPRVLDLIASFSATLTVHYHLKYPTINDGDGAGFPREEGS